MVFVSVWTSASVRAQKAFVASSPIVFPGIKAVLGSLPTAHVAPPIGTRMSGQGCHGASRVEGAPQRIRFVYFATTGDNGIRTNYHRHLINAEILLNRVLAAHDAGLRSMAPSLDYAAEARATVPPPSGMFHRSTLEYRRWYRADGSVRERPLTQEALSLRLAATEGLSMREARARAAQRSHALSASDQSWLIVRRSIPLSERPLSGAEFLQLTDALDGIWLGSSGQSHVERANRQIALKMVAVLGNLLDEYVASPFKAVALGEAFNEHHLAHLRQTIINSLDQATSESRTLLAGPKAWFAAKAARMHAEHQVGLARSPASSAPLRLMACPVVAMVGGRLHTFLNGRRAGPGKRFSSSAADMLVG